MKLASPRLWIGVLSGAGVLYLAVGDMFRTSPGPLASVHARAVSDWQSCAQCHGGWFGEMAESCLECHTDIAEQVERGTGFHGAVEAAKARSCALCHSEHHGPDFAMVNGQSFLQAGIPDRSEFKHEMVGFAMAGKHLEQECKTCHVNADVAVLPEGEKRFLGLAQDCATCHEDAHEGRMTVACAQCHSQESFDVLASADHDRYLPLTGGHAEVSCAECHAEDGQWSLEALGHGTAAPARSCADCHDSPHREPFVAGVAARVNKKPGASCGACHLPTHTDFRDENVTTPPHLHAASGFALDLPHDEAACDACHTGSDFAARYPGRNADTCATCHDDPHGGQFADGPFAEQGCVGCHERTHFAPHAFGVEKHARTALPLDGSHLDATCDACHTVPGKAQPRIFRGTSSNCEGCHTDAHQGFFRKHARQTPESCSVCHLTTAFSEIPDGKFHHGTWTRFTAEGAHAQVDCEECHQRSETPDEHGRTFGRASEHFGTFRGCVTCHTDPHRGEFDRPSFPQKVNGLTGCARCHVETSFRAFPKGFDHGKWTGFPLSGAHGEIGCSDCHAPMRKPDKFGRTWGRAKGSSCGDCHTDPHAGQFDVNGTTDCQRCHSTASRFDNLVFHHDRDSRFRLGVAHTGLACAACHTTVREKGVEFVRYRPLGRQCADCHEAQKDPFKRRNR